MKKSKDSSPASTSWETWEQKISNAQNAEELSEIEQILFGRKEGVMTLAMKELRDTAEAERASKAKELNVAKKMIMDALEKRQKELHSLSSGKLSEDAIDVTLDLPTKERGHLHPIPEFIRHVEEVFGRMGFDVARGPEAETEEYNFNLLNIPADHPARDSQDTFWVAEDPPPADASHRLVLRTHTSPGQVRYMQSHKPPFRVICPGTVYRKDADATHSPMFHQFEGLMVGKDVSLANMKAVMITAIRELISPTAQFRFRTGFFPFVEPGLEVDMRWEGDETESREGAWLEIVGCGMVHPKVLENAGIDPKQWQGFAFGFGVERMIMLKHRIPDLRLFYEGDLRFLRQF